MCACDTPHLHQSLLGHIRSSTHSLDRAGGKQCAPASGSAVESAGRGDSASGCGQRTQEPAAAGQTSGGEANGRLILKKIYSSFGNNLLGKQYSWGFALMLLRNSISLV